MSAQIVGTIRGSAGGVGEKKGWALVFLLQPFRIDDGDVIKKQMRVVTTPVSEKELTSWMRKLKDGDTVTFSGDELEPPKQLPWWYAHARFPIKRVRADAILSKERKALDKKVVVRDPALGTVTFDRTYEQWTGKRNGFAFDLATKDVERGRKMLLAIEKQLPKLRDAIVKKMLPLYNDTWREDAPKLGPRAFRARLSIEAISVMRDGRATIFFDADEMFTDHAIEVRLSKTLSINEIHLAG